MHNRHVIKSWDKQTSVPKNCENLGLAALIQLIEAEWHIYASVNKSSLVQIMACRLTGAKPLSEPMLENW